LVDGDVDARTLLVELDQFIPVFGECAVSYPGERVRQFRQFPFALLLAQLVLFSACLVGFGALSLAFLVVIERLERESIGARIECREELLGPGAVGLERRSAAV